MNVFKIIVVLVFWSLLTYALIEVCLPANLPRNIPQETPQQQIDDLQYKADKTVDEERQAKSDAVRARDQDHPDTSNSVVVNYEDAEHSNLPYNHNE